MNPLVILGLIASLLVLSGYLAQGALVALRLTLVAGAWTLVGATMVVLAAIRALAGLLDDYSTRRCTR